mmetsp:Transcript_18249/g.17938  ORF Transcript_18249/g.17938 Transcript_18249/m.17938 type:complete len:213 (-) Transcript_18249:273-911(-)
MSEFLSFLVKISGIVPVLLGVWDLLQFFYILDRLFEEINFFVVFFFLLGAVGLSQNKLLNIFDSPVDFFGSFELGIHILLKRLELFLCFLADGFFFLGLLVKLLLLCDESSLFFNKFFERFAFILGSFSIGLSLAFFSSSLKDFFFVSSGLLDLFDESLNFVIELLHAFDVFIFCGFFKSIFFGDLFWQLSFKSHFDFFEFWPRTEMELVEE